MTFEAYLIYLAALAACFATPPDTSQLLIMSSSLRHGVRRSLWTVAGDLSANVVPMTAAGFGLAAIVATSAGVLVWVKWLGVAYLIWIGISLLRAKPRDHAPEAAARTGAGVLFRQGFLTSGANPYAVVFLGALFPQFIDPTAPILPQLVVLGGTYLLVDGVTLILRVVFARQTLGRLKGLTGRGISRISGGLMIGAAALSASRDMGVSTR